MVGLKKDGSVVTAGKTQYGINEAEGWSDMKKISAGDYHLVGLTATGELVAVMNDDPNEKRAYRDACCKFETWPAEENIVDISAGNGTMLGLSSDGTVYSCGYGGGRQGKARCRGLTADFGRRDRKANQRREEETLGFVSVKLSLPERRSTEHIF